MGKRRVPKIARKVKKKLDKGKVDEKKAREYEKKVNQNPKKFKIELECLDKYLKNKETDKANKIRGKSVKEVNRKTKPVLEELSIETFLSILPGGLAGAIGKRAEEEGVEMKEVAEKFKKSMLKDLDKNTKVSRIKADASKKALDKIENETTEELEKRKKELQNKIQYLNKSKEKLEKARKA